MKINIFYLEYSARKFEYLEKLDHLLFFIFTHMYIHILVLYIWIYRILRDKSSRKCRTTGGSVAFATPTIGGPRYQMRTWLIAIDSLFSFFQHYVIIFFLTDIKHYIKTLFIKHSFFSRILYLPHAFNRIKPNFSESREKRQHDKAIKKTSEGLSRSWDTL